MVKFLELSADVVIDLASLLGKKETKEKEENKKEDKK